MSTAKALLKAVKGALDGQKYREAVEGSRRVLETNPDNYHAYVDVHASMSAH